MPHGCGVAFARPTLNDISLPECHLGFSRDYGSSEVIRSGSRVRDYR